MAESNPFIGFGVHDVRIYSISTGESLAHLRVLGDVSGDFSADTAKLEGGSQNYPWRVDITGFKGSMKVKCKEYDPDAMAIFMGGAATKYVAAATGDIIDEANVKGTSLLSAAGFATVTVTSGDHGDLKPGWYLCKAASTSTFDIYAYSSAHFSRGNDETFEDETGKLTSSPLTIPSATGDTVVVADLGLTFTRGASALSVTSGDTFRFFVQSPFAKAWKVKFGQASSTFDDVGVVIAGERSSGEGLMAHFYRCKCLGGPIVFSRKGYAELDLTIEPQYDSSNDGVGEFVAIREA